MTNSQGRKIKKKKQTKIMKEGQGITHSRLLLFCFLSCLIKLLLKGLLERFHFFPSLLKTQNTNFITSVLKEIALHSQEKAHLIIQSNRQMYPMCLASKIIVPV